MGTDFIVIFSGKARKGRVSSSGLASLNYFQQALGCRDCLLVAW